MEGGGKSGGVRKRAGGEKKQSDGEPRKRNRCVFSGGLEPVDGLKPWIKLLFFFLTREKDVTVARVREEARA